MPYIKIKEDALAPLLRAANMANSVKLAKILGCSHQTAMRKIRDPGRFTVADLRKINRIGHMPIEEIRRGI